MLFCIVVCVVALGAGAAMAQPAPAKFSSASLTLGSPTGVAESLAAGDFNGDGKQDLIAVGGYNPQAANILLGNGDGTFANPTVIPLYVRNSGGDGIAAHNQHVVAVGDFNGDGKLDFAVYIWGWASGTNYLDVYLGDGTGNFSFSNSYSVGNVGKASGGYTSVVAVDVNGGGKLDLVATNTGDNTVTVLLGNGDGTFQNGVLYPACTFCGCSPIIVAAQLQQDGHPDLAWPTGQ